MSSASGIQLLNLHTYFNYAGVFVDPIILNIILYVICFFKLYLTKVNGIRAHFFETTDCVLKNKGRTNIFQNTVFLIYTL